MAEYSSTSVKQVSRRYSRSEWWLMGSGITVAITLLGFIGLLVRSRDIPRLTIPSPSPLPSPNAFDVFQRAASLTTGEAGEMTMGIRPKPSPAERAAMLRRNQIALDTFRTAFEYPYQNPSARTYKPQYAHLVSFAELSQTAVWEARDLWEHKQIAEATETGLELVRFGLAIPRGGSVRHLITSLNIEEDGQEILWSMRDAMSASVARTAARELCKMEKQRVPYAAILEEQKWSALSATLELYKTGQMTQALQGNGGTVQSPQPTPWWESLSTSLSLAPIPPSQVLSKMTYYLDAQIEQAKRPYQPAPTIVPMSNDPVNRRMVNMDYHGLHVRLLNNEVQNLLLAVALALRAYRLEKVDYPANLDLLVSSGYLSAMPQDPFTNGQPLRYRRLSANKYILYSVGPDARDNSGNPITREGKPVTTAVSAGMTGDVVVGKNIR